MPKQFNLKVNKFDRGFITEASPLNFPEGASVAEENFTISPDGSRERRLGVDFEKGFGLLKTGFSATQLTEKEVFFFRWMSPNNDPTLDIGVACVGNRLYFFDMTKEAPSAHPLNLGAYLTIPNNSTSTTVSGAVVNGFLILASSSFIYPVVLEYNKVYDSVSATQIKLKIRDLQGVDDGLPLNQRPTSLSLEHKYNLINQGWTTSIETVPDGTSEVQFIEAYRGVGGTSGNVTWGGVTWWQDEHNDDIPIGAVNNKIFRGCKYPATAAKVGSQLHITFDPRDGPRPQYDFEQGRCLWNGCSIVSGRVTAGTLTAYPDVMTYLQIKTGEYPSNCDIVSLGLMPASDSLYYNKFDLETFRKNTGYLNLGEAPKGHNIIDAIYRGSSRKAIVPGVSSDSDSSSVSVCCGHAGRVFYSGVEGETLDKDARTINSQSLIYFTQIITDKTKLERCYQENDPTDQRQFELAAGDGGTIFIPGCTGVTHLESFGNSILVFSKVGIWEITGGNDLFSATSYSVNKLAVVSCIAPRSVVLVDDAIIFWALEGIYSLSRNQYGQIEIEQISKETIQSFCNRLSDKEKSSITGYYDNNSSSVRWLLPGEKEPTVEADVILAYRITTGVSVKNISVSNGVPYNMEWNATATHLGDTTITFDVFTQCGTPIVNLWDTVGSIPIPYYSVDKGKTWSKILSNSGTLNLEPYSWCEHNGGVVQPSAIRLTPPNFQPAFSADGITWTSVPRNVWVSRENLLISHHGLFFSGHNTIAFCRNPDTGILLDFNNYDPDYMDKINTIVPDSPAGRYAMAPTAEFALYVGANIIRTHPCAQEFHNGEIMYVQELTEYPNEEFRGMYMFNNEIYALLTSGIILRRADVNQWVRHTTIPNGVSATSITSSGSTIVLCGFDNRTYKYSAYTSFNGRTFNSVLEGNLDITPIYGCVL